MPQEIRNRLEELRKARGLSVIQLAAASGAGRQTIYAIETGTYVPNTALALRLARALETSVEEIFHLPGDEPAALPILDTTLLDGGTLAPRQPVQLARVGNRWIATPPSPVPCYLPPADALIGAASASGHARVELLQDQSTLERRIVVAGCDPGMSVLARHAQAAGIELVLAHRNSSQSLALLKAESVHIAGSHLRDARSGESNLPQIARLFPRDTVAIFSLAWWEEGIVTSPGNPKQLGSAADLVRPGIMIVNRERGAGARALLDQELTRFGIRHEQVRGYAEQASGHLHAAWRVAAGEADCCIATRASAQRFGLGFVPLVRERYDLTLHRRDLENPGVQGLLNVITHLRFRRELSALGYDTEAAGSRLL